MYRCIDIDIYSIGPQTVHHDVGELAVEEAWAKVPLHH